MKAILKPLFGAFIVWHFAACYQDREGCLDALATNFDVNADINSGCVYPELTFNISHRFDTVNFDLGSVYLNLLNQPFIPLAISFYISEVSLLTDMDLVTVDDLLQFRDQQGNLTVVPDDITKIRRSSFSFAIGSFLTPNSYRSLQFSLGLDASLTSAQSFDIDDDHPLDSSSNELFDAQLGYIMARAELISDTSALDTLVIDLPANPTIPMSLPVDLFKDRGEAIAVPLVIDYRHWFDRIDFEQDDLPTIRTKLADGIQRSFFVNQ